MKSGDMLPTEPEIEKMYQVSRMTVRKAIEELVAEGRVSKQQGRGTFVQSPGIIQEAGKITSWTEEMKLKGKETKTIGLQILEIYPSNKLAADLSLKKNEKVVCIKRVRVVDGEPLAIMVNYLRSTAVPGLLESGLTSESLYEELENRYNIVIERATERIRAREASELEAISLNIPPYSAVLQVTRLSYLSDGMPFEVVEMTTRADRYQYHIELSGRRKMKIVSSE
jgi:GntR family transcriptional regulator